MTSLHPALGEYLEDVRSVRPRREPAQVGALDVDPASVLRFRARRQNLYRRLPTGQLVRAASGGLQDSAPRAALLALHARCEGVGPGSWEDPGLVQIWSRWADYVVPRADVGVFTLGALPRDFQQRAALDDLADRVVAALAGQARPAREVAVAMGVLSHPGWLRCASITGKVHIRWDARTVTVHPAVPVEIDPEEVRVELARRYLSWMGPANAASFARWAGVTISDAGVTWAKIRPELLPVGLNGDAEWILAVDESALEDGGPSCQGARLLPLGDPFLWPLGGMGSDCPPRARRLCWPKAFRPGLSTGSPVGSLPTARWSVPGRGSAASCPSLSGLPMATTCERPCMPKRSVWQHQLGKRSASVG